MSWWDKSFSDVGWQQRRRREEAADDLDKGDAVASVQRLFALDEAQAQEIQRLRLTVRVLTEILVDTMGLDAGLLHQRMVEAIGEAKTGQEPVRPAASSDATPAQVSGRARCSICSAPAEVESTHFAEFGMVCDACHAVGKPIEEG